MLMLMLVIVIVIVLPTPEAIEVNRPYLSGGRLAPDGSESRPYL